MDGQDGGERLTWIGLAWVQGLGPAAFWRLIGRFGAPSGIVRAAPEDLAAVAPRLQPQTVAAIGELDSSVTSIEETIAELSENAVRVLCAFEPDFPARLHEAAPVPPVVCVWGELRPEDDQAVSIVGTRSASAEGLDMAQALSAAFANQGMTVVSGLARGCDTAAHVGALEAGGRTIAVLGCGINVCHPSENAPLAHRIAAQGAVLSELAPEVRPSVPRLMARNRLQSALSKAVVVVEAGAKGGSHQTTDTARRQGRLVVAIEWPPSDCPERAGVAQLLRSGALPVRGPADVPELAARVRAHVCKPRPGRGRESAAQLELWPGEEAGL